MKGHKLISNTYGNMTVNRQFTDPETVWR